MKKIVLSLLAALGIGGLVIAQQGTFVPGTPSPLNPFLTGSDPTPGATCTTPNQVNFNYITRSQFYCGSATIGSTSGPFIWQNTNPWAPFIYGMGPAVASATTIAPTYSIQHVTGTTAIATITAPTGTLAGTRLTLIFDGAGSWTAAGNIKSASPTIAAGQAFDFVFDTATSLWYPVL